MNYNKVVFQFVRISFSILVILLILIGFVKISTKCYDFGYRIFTEQPVDAEPGRDVTVNITADMSGMDIAKELAQKGLVEDAKIFYVQMKLSAYSGKLNAGVFTLNTSMEAKEMMAVMAAEPEQSDDTSGQSEQQLLEQETGTEADEEPDTAAASENEQ